MKRTDFWYILAVVMFVAALLWLGGRRIIGLLEQAEAVRSFSRSLGPFAPLAYIVLFAMQILIAPIPGQFFAVMSGYLFGVFWGSIYSIAGLALGAGASMLLARHFGRPLLERFWDAETVQRWERKFRMRSPVTWGLLFVFPVPDLVFYVAGISSAPLGQLLVAVIAGRSIGLVIANWVGTFSATLPPEWVAVKWAVLLAVSLIVYRYQRRVRLFVLLSARRWRHFRHRRLLVQ